MASAGQTASAKGCCTLLEVANDIPHMNARLPPDTISALEAKLVNTIAARISHLAMQLRKGDASDDVNDLQHQYSVLVNATGKHYRRKYVKIRTRPGEPVRG